MDADAMPADDRAAATARDRLLAELRAARSEALQAGAGEDAMTAGIEERLRRLRRELEAADKPPPAAG